jgi:phenylpyruvate tautomerase PptA (4-oxalocrotonate tautomerase family)
LNAPLLEVAGEALKAGALELVKPKRRFSAFFASRIVTFDVWVVDAKASNAEKRSSLEPITDFFCEAASPPPSAIVVIMDVTPPKPPSVYDGGEGAGLLGGGGGAPVDACIPRTDANGSTACVVLATSPIIAPIIVSMLRRLSFCNGVPILDADAISRRLPS